MESGSSVKVRYNKPLARWRGSLGGGTLGRGAQRAWSGFWNGSAEWGRWFLGDPQADPLSEWNPHLSAPVYAALIVFTPGGKGKGATIVVRFGDDALRSGAAGVRGVGAGDDAARVAYRAGQAAMRNVRAGRRSRHRAPSVRDQVRRVLPEHGPRRGTRAEVLQEGG